MARLYHRLFYQLHCFFSFTAREGWEASKALIAVNALCALLALQAWVWAVIALKRLVDITLTTGPHPLWVVAPLGFAIAGTNYRFFLHRQRWKAYARQFRTEAAPRQRRAAWGAFAAVLAVVGGLIGAFYCMSCIKWAN